MPKRNHLWCDGGPDDGGPDPPMETETRLRRKMLVLENSSLTYVFTVLILGLLFSHIDHLSCC